jgi:hypothetical protein
MSKMGSHYPFEYLKHKLWSKEWLGIKSSIWLSPQKVENRLIYVCAGGVSFNVRKLSTRATTLLKTHFIWRFTQEVMGVQNGGSPNFGNYGTFNLKS